MPGSDSGLTRRQLLVAGAAAAGYAAAAGPVSAEAIHTDAEGLEEGLVEVPAPGLAMRAYGARPAGDAAAPVVLVVHEIFGVHEYVRDVCRRLARDGYFAVAPDLYQRQGDPAKLADVQSILKEVVYRVPDEQVLSDLDATLAWARKNGGHPKTAGITGFCWGGRIVWLYAAHNPNLKAGIAWYGPLDWPRGPLHKMTPISLAGKIKAPILGLYGAQDGGIPLARLRALEKALKASGNTKSRIHVYPDAGHAFHADYRPSYRERPAKDGWKRLNAWLMANGAR